MATCRQEGRASQGEGPGNGSPLQGHIPTPCPALGAGSWICRVAASVPGESRSFSSSPPAEEGPRGSAGHTLLVIHFLLCSVQEGAGHTEESPVEGHHGDQVLGVALLGGETERAGATQPGTEGDLTNIHQSLQGDTKGCSCP